MTKQEILSDIRSKLSSFEIKELSNFSPLKQITLISYCSKEKLLELFPNGQYFEHHEQHEWVTFTYKTSIYHSMKFFYTESEQ